MNEKSFSLAQEKRDKMINGAMEIFASAPYKKASIDDIATRCNVSKALFFHYFSSKSELYVYIYEYARKALVAQVAESYDKSETDFFKMLINAQECKLAVMRHTRGFLNFFRVHMLKPHPMSPPQ